MVQMHILMVLARLMQCMVIMVSVGLQPQPITFLGKMGLMVMGVVLVMVVLEETEEILTGPLNMVSFRVVEAVAQDYIIVVTNLEDPEAVEKCLYTFNYEEVIIFCFSPLL